jgi:hypothetical protein
VPAPIEQRHAKVRFEDARLQAKVPRAAAEAMTKDDRGTRAERLRVKLHPFPKDRFFSVVKLDPAAYPLV